MISKHPARIQRRVLLIHHRPRRQIEELDLAPEDDIAPGSVQPVVSINANGERLLELMRWGFKLPDRLLWM